MKRNIELELKQMAIVRKSVESYFEKMAHLSIFDFDWMSEEDKDHIKRIACSIMNARLGIGFEPGGFVKAVLDNNLSGAFANADSTNQRALKFYMLMIYNLGINITISEETASI
jgi:hypothetical protein